MLLGQTYQELQKLQNEYKKALERQSLQKPTEISKLINSFDKVDIRPSLIQPLKEIKSLGSFKVKINLHAEVQAEITIKVISQDNIK